MCTSSTKATGSIINEQVRTTITLASGIYLLKLITPTDQKVLRFVGVDHLVFPNIQNR